MGKFSSTNGNWQSGCHTALLSEAGGSSTEENKGYGEGETFDTASSPLKRRLNFGSEDSRATMADRIRARKEREKDERKAREKAFDDGLIGPGGKVAEGVENVILISLEEEEVHPKVGMREQRGDKPMEEQRGMIDLNLVPLESGLCCNLETDCGVISGQMIGIGGHSFEGQEASSVVCTHDSDPFNLGPIIEAISRERTAKKRGLGEIEEHKFITSGIPIRVRQRATKDICEAEETSLEGSPKTS